MIGKLVHRRDIEIAFQVMNELKGEVIEIPYTAGVNSSEFIDSIKSIGTTPQIRLNSLRRLIDAKPIVRILNHIVG